MDFFDVCLFGVFWVLFPLVGFLKVLDFPFDIFKDFVLQGGDFLLPGIHTEKAPSHHIKAQQLPFKKTLRLFDVFERVALKDAFAVGLLLEELTIFALNHITLHFRKKLPLKFSYYHIYCRFGRC